MKIIRAIFTTILFSLSANVLAEKSIQLVHIKNNEVSVKDKSLTFGKGSTWKLWEKLHKSCMKADWFKDPYFFGVSSTLSVGSIVSNRYELANKMDQFYFTDAQLATLIDPGNPTNCAEQQTITVDFEALISSTQLKNAELASAIKTSKSVTASIDSWQVQNLIFDRLIKLIRDDSTGSLEGYKESLMHKGNKILVKVVKINGFKSIIELKSAMSTDLKASLQGKGLSAKLNNTSASVDVSFEYISDTTISMKSSGGFYVFGNFMEAKYN